MSGRRLGSQILSVLGLQGVTPVTALDTSADRDASAFWRGKGMPPPQRLAWIIGIAQRTGFAGGWKMLVLTVCLVSLQILRYYIVYFLMWGSKAEPDCLGGVAGGRWRVLGPWIVGEVMYVIDFANMCAMHWKLGMSIWKVPMSVEHWVVVGNSLKESGLALFAWTLLGNFHLCLLSTVFDGLQTTVIAAEVCGRLIAFVPYALMNAFTFGFASKMLSRTQAGYLKRFREGLSLSEAVRCLEQANLEIRKYATAISLDSAFAPLMFLVGTWLLYDYFFLPWGHWSHLVFCAVQFTVFPLCLWDLVKANEFPKELVAEVISRAPTYPDRTAEESAVADDTCQWTLQERIHFCEFIKLSSPKMTILAVVVNRDLLRQTVLQISALFCLFWQLNVGSEWLGLEGYRDRVPTCQ